MQIDKQCTPINTTNFTALKVKVKGKYFKMHPEQKQAIINHIKNNEGLTEFYSTRRGKIVINAKTVPVPVYVPYVNCLQQYGKPRGFDTIMQCPQIRLDGTYSRAFALRNLLRKPVWYNAGCGGTIDSTWDKCIETVLKFIDNFGEKFSKNGKDLFSIEAKRLHVEKP